MEEPSELEPDNAHHYQYPEVTPLTRYVLNIILPRLDEFFPTPKEEIDEPPAEQLDT